MTLAGGAAMLLRVQPGCPVPLYEQVTAQVVFAVASAALVPGDMIPSVRELAAQLLVHPNTVARAFQDLERLGVVRALRGRGMEVTAEAPAWCRSHRQDLVRGRIRDALYEAVSSGLTPEAIVKLVQEELARANGRKGSRG
jgi:GntR family transcriptional regulator